MDINIRSLLCSAKFCKGKEKTLLLQQAFTQIRSVFEARPVADGPELFGQDLFVQCAEIAFEHGLKDITRDCLKMFFLKQQPTNQFLIRAYLCQAQLLAPQDANKPEELDKAVVYILKAISLAKQTDRYHFLVYNASVIYWHFCRPFLKPNFRQFLAQSLHQVVQALGETDDQDFEWRAKLTISLIECLLDAGQKADASSISMVGAAFIKQNVPHLYKQIFGLMVRHQLVELTKLNKEAKTSPELIIYYRICRLKCSLDLQEVRDYQGEIINILKQMGVAIPQFAVYSKKSSLKKTAGRSSSPDVSDVSDRTGNERQELDRSNPSASKGGRRTPTPTPTPTPTTPKVLEDEAISNLKLTLNSKQSRSDLLMELAHLCLDLDLGKVASVCVEEMKTCPVKDQSFCIQMEFLECLLMVKSLGENQESYQKSVVDLRLQAIKRCEEAIMNAIRHGDPSVIQAGCVAEWNLCLPLLQPNLRHYIHKTLSLIAEALENIQSLLIKLRCQLHTELAKCEESKEQIQVAMEHLKKALALDDGNVYQERLEVMLRRLQLRSQLYRQPERPEDQAAMIIEQAQKADSGSVLMKRSMLVKAGEALAPDAFLLVLDSENDSRDLTEINKDNGTIKSPLTFSKKLSAKARFFNHYVSKAEGHLKRLGKENDRERARLWADLAKTARKQGVWDVCRVAARFCLLYDDGRWKGSLPRPMSSKQERTKGDTKEKTEDETDKKAGSRPLTPNKPVELYDRDLVRMLAEVNFINGEAIVLLLRSEGVQLNDKPIFPESHSKLPKGKTVAKPENDPDWLEYCNWIRELSEASTSSFLRGLELGVDLMEPWLVCNAAAYIWNYNNHILTQMRHREILLPLTAVLDGLKRVGHAGETSMLVNICNTLAFALIQPWIPEAPKEEKDQDDLNSKNKLKVSVSQGKIKGSAVSLVPEATVDIKKAVEVCEYAINMTSREHIVPIAARKLILQTWVMSKQMAQQQIGKTFGTDDESSTEGQKEMTRAIVATEMLSLNSNGIMEFKDVPSIADVAQMVENCQWTDSLIKLQMLTRLTSLAYHSHQHNLVMRCSKAALELASINSHMEKKGDIHQYMVKQEMLAYASILQGQSLVDNMGGKHSLRRDAMEAFLGGASFARNAGNYDLVMTAARHYWNACIDLVSQPMERQLLKEPIKTILDCITATWNKKSKIEERVEQVALTEEPKIDDINKKDEKKTPSTETSISTIDNQSDDLTLRAAMYGVLFQSYADQGELEMSLKAMDQAVADMPRTKHRLLIFKHRVITKAKLGQNVQMDFQKFQGESEDYVAHMWRKVALCSNDLREQLSSYQNAIESLISPSNGFQKVDYLLEFSQWLYYNHFPLQDVLDQVEWAIDILLNMQDEEAMQLKKEGTKPNATTLDSKKLSKAAKRTEKKKSKELPLGKASVTSLQKISVTEGSGMTSTGREDKALDGRLEVSDQETEISAGDFVPQAKEVVIGVLPSNPGLKISDLTNVQQLDALVRSHILLAELTGQDGTCYADILLQAQGYLVRLWQVLIKEAGPVMKIVQQGHPEQAPPKGKGSAKEKKSTKEQKSEVTQSSVKERRRGPLDVVPELIEEWAVYNAPDELIEAFQQESMKKSGLNVDTFPKPMLTMHYLDILTRQLRVLGYNHLALPVLAFQDLLSRSMLINHSLNILIHARALEVCLELDLKAGCEFHELSMGNISISEKEQFQSREEIALWKEKKAQVAREEMRVKDSLARTTAESSSRAKDGRKTTASHLGKVLGAVCQREVWADLAEVLIRLGYLQKAREYLNEANIAAEAFSDTTLQGHIMYLFGKLAFEEAQFGQATNFCKAAQEIHQGDEMFWFETMLLLVESVICDYTNKNRRHLALKLLAHAVNEFLKITNERPNRYATLNFIMTTFEAKAASVQMQIILDHHKDINSPVAMKSVLTVCEKLDNCVEKLIRLGHRRKAVTLTTEHASYLIMLARAATEVQVEHGYYLEALSVLKEAASLAEQVFTDALTLTSLQESQTLSFPVQRELANVYACQGELLVEVAALQVKEMRSIQLAEQRKGSIIRLVEEYTHQSPLLSPTQKGWLSKRLTVFEEAMTVLINAHSLAGNITELKIKALAGLGKVLRILAEHKDPDPPPLWLVWEIEQLYQNADTEETEQEATEAGKINDKQDHVLASDDDNTTETRRFSKNSQLILSMTKQHEASKLYYVYATECLFQGLSLAIAKKHKALAGQIALDLVKCFGQFDPNLASQFLALYQSCQTSLKLEELLYKAQRDPTSSRLAALLHQHQTLIRNNISTNLGKSNMMTSVLKLLEQDCQAWKQLEILPNHLDILKEFPQNFNFVILQHSPDRDFLYGAVMEKPKISGGGGGKSNPRVSTGPELTLASGSRAKIFGVDTDPRVLQSIIEKFRQHKQNVQTLLLKQEYRRTQAIQRQRMLENTDDDSKLSQKGTVEILDESQHLEEDFQNLVNDMENYLRPVIAAVDAALSLTSSKDASNECFILLPDADLLELPLEALSCLQADGIDSLTRDFSLQMFYHRMFSGAVTDEKTTKSTVKTPPKNAGVDKKKKQEVPQVLSRIQGANEPKGKQSKSNLVKRSVQPWQVAVENNNIKYIVDPYREGSETDERKPGDQFRHILEDYEQLTHKWLGIYGEDHTPSVGEWELYIKESSTFLFYGFERLVAYLSPAKLSALNIPDCMMMYVLDQAQTSKSFMRQSKVDTLKSQNELALEGPLEMAMMVSLAGTKCVLTNQWSCTLAENTNKLELTMKDLLERGMSSGQAVRLLLSPPKRRALEERLAAEELASAPSVSQKGKDKDAKGSEKQKSKVQSVEPPISDDPDKDRESPKEKPAQPQSDWFNMVCYGMPNLVIT
ncbi:cilia- and flagella-associated protein 46-like isoform X2 [Pomacea canaliculata]|uniref:cilia- and flagella-associated protein 46-like isoform X2 n=1 Tax=Pomacea canaliculata TaxID=400727 RepID=UPI000D740018|nr:cilia- and flagella-associated protein 46-like isoform X2 [Pomacea canaliculata]